MPGSTACRSPLRRITSVVARRPYERRLMREWRLKKPRIGFADAGYLLKVSILSIMDTKEIVMHVSSTEFQQNVGRYQDAAQHGPVIITKRDRPHTVLLSAAMFEILTKGRIARKVEDLDDDTIAAIAGASTPEGHDNLDHLLEDWKP